MLPRMRLTWMPQCNGRTATCGNYMGSDPEVYECGSVSFTTVVSMLIFFTWVGCLFTTLLLPITGEGWLSGVVFIPLIMVGMLLTKLASDPIALFLKKTGYHGEEQINFFGCAGKMLSSIGGDKIGIAEFMIEEDPVKLNVVSIDGNELRYGDKVIITEGPNEKNIYLVVKDKYY